MLEVSAARMYPKEDTPKEKIHRFLAPTELPGCFMCYVCGHYTWHDRTERAADE